MKNSSKNAIALAVLALGVALAPTAHAQPRPETGVGKVIAAQGNAALEVIRSEVKAAIKLFMPAVAAPAPKPTAVKARQTAGAPGWDASARCAS